MELASEDERENYSGDESEDSVDLIAVPAPIKRKPSKKITVTEEGDLVAEELNSDQDDDEFSVDSFFLPSNIINDLNNNLVLDEDEFNSDRETRSLNYDSATLSDPSEWSNKGRHQDRIPPLLKSNSNSKFDAKSKESSFLDRTWSLDASFTAPRKYYTQSSDSELEESKSINKRLDFQSTTFRSLSSDSTQEPPPKKEVFYSKSDSALVHNNFANYAGSEFALQINPGTHIPKDHERFGASWGSSSDLSSSLNITNPFEIKSSSAHTPAPFSSATRLSTSKPSSTFVPTRPVPLSPSRKLLSLAELASMPVEYVYQGGEPSYTTNAMSPPNQHQKYPMSPPKHSREYQGASYNQHQTGASYSSSPATMYYGAASKGGNFTQFSNQQSNAYAYQPAHPRSPKYQSHGLAHKPQRRVEEKKKSTWKVKSSQNSSNNSSPGASSSSSAVTSPGMTPRAKSPADFSNTISSVKDDTKREHIISERDASQDSENERTMFTSRSQNNAHFTGEGDFLSFLTDQDKKKLSERQMKKDQIVATVQTIHTVIKGFDQMMEPTKSFMPLEGLKFLPNIKKLATPSLEDLFQDPTSSIIEAFNLVDKPADHNRHVLLEKVPLLQKEPSDTSLELESESPSLINPSSSTDYSQSGSEDLHALPSHSQSHTDTDSLRLRTPISKQSSISSPCDSAPPSSDENQTLRTTPNPQDHLSLPPIQASEKAPRVVYRSARSSSRKREVETEIQRQAASSFMRGSHRRIRDRTRIEDRRSEEIKESDSDRDTLAIQEEESKEQQALIREQEEAIIRQKDREEELERARERLRLKEIELEKEKQRAREKKRELETEMEIERIKNEEEKRSVELKKIQRRERRALELRRKEEERQNLVALKEMEKVTTKASKNAEKPKQQEPIQEETEKDTNPEETSQEMSDADAAQNPSPKVEKGVDETPKEVKPQSLSWLITKAFLMMSVLLQSPRSSYSRAFRAYLMVFTLVYCVWTFPTNSIEPFSLIGFASGYILLLWMQILFCTLAFPNFGVEDLFGRSLKEL